MRDSGGPTTIRPDRKPFFLQVAFTGATKGGAGKPPGLAAATAVWSRRRRLHSTAAVPQVQEPLLPTATMLEHVTSTYLIYLNRFFVELLLLASPVRHALAASTR